MRRSALTLVELMLAAAIAVVVLIIAFNAIILLVKGERSIDRESSKALNDSILMQALMQDVRSSFNITEVSPGKEFQIDRWSPGAGGRLAPQLVIWRVAAAKVTREAAGSIDTFHVSGSPDPRSLAARFRIERITDIRFPEATRGL